MIHIYIIAAAQLSIVGLMIAHPGIGCVWSLAYVAPAWTAAHGAAIAIAVQAAAQAAQ